MVERREQVEVDERVAAILGTERTLARRDLADAVARFGGLSGPRRAESNRLLSELALAAGRLVDGMADDGIERADAALSILQPSRPTEDPLALAICVADLGGLDRPDPVPDVPEPDWTLADTLGVALDELVEPVAYGLLDELAARGDLQLR